MVRTTCGLQPKDQSSRGAQRRRLIADRRSPEEKVCAVAQQVWLIPVSGVIFVLPNWGVFGYD